MMKIVAKTFDWEIFCVTAPLEANVLKVLILLLRRKLNNEHGLELLIWKWESRAGIGKERSEKELWGEGVVERRAGLKRARICNGARS